LLQERKRSRQDYNQSQHFYIHITINKKEKRKMKGDSTKDDVEMEQGSETILPIAAILPDKPSQISIYQDW
jgi:hypothetical protein